MYGRISKFLIIVISLISQQIYAQTYQLSNNAYSVKYHTASKTLKVVNLLYPSDTVNYTAAFNVLVKSGSPNVGNVNVTEDISYYTSSWGGNTNFYKAGALRIRDVQSVTPDGNKLYFTYTENEEFKLSAVFELPEGNGYPSLTYKLQSKISTGYSVGYNGSPKYDVAQLDELWQPGIWTEKKFPQSPYLTLAYKCQLPTTMATYNGVTYGVITDPDYFPYDPLPTFQRSNFGVAIRNSDGLSQPMIWAPILGTATSKINAGDSLTFKIRLFCGRKSIPEYAEEIALKLYGFSEYDRNNVLGSLNTTLENMIDYGLSEYSRFNEALKAPSYETDVPGAVSAVSALNAINLAYLTDNENIMQKRGLPMMEFLLSRSNSLYANEETTGVGLQTAYNTLGTPVMKLSEMAALYTISGKKMPFLLEFAKNKQTTSSDPYHERQLKQYIALYKATGNTAYKSLAVMVADQYIIDRVDNLETGFNYQHHYKSSFWLQLAPKFIDLLEVYDLTGRQKYLDAAYKAAKRYLLYTWMSPKVPETSILVNKDNLAPLYRTSLAGSRISIPEETVPAWRMSDFGLNSEAAATANSHRAVFMAHHAPFFMRIGTLKNDEYLKKVAKSSIIGRYTNFPGYTIKIDRTTVYEKPDFPCRSHEELSSTTSMHYNHIWPMMSLLMDYLVNDAIAKSSGNINFPSEYVEGSSYMQDKIYGHSPGSFYHIDSVTLWMPKRLLDISHQELNYISARKNDTLMVAFTNQSGSAVSSQVIIDTALVKVKEGALLTIINNNGTPVENTLSGQEFSVNVPANGITAVIIKGADIVTKLQEKFKTSPDSSWTKDYLSDPFAMTQAMLLNFGDQLSRAYIYSASEKGKYTSITLKYTLNGTDTLTITDNDYPFEFSVDMPIGAENFAFIIETTDINNNVENSGTLTLNKRKVISAKIRGKKYIRPGENAFIPVAFEGTAPWNFSYTDGTTVHHVNNVTANPYRLVVQPSATTTYTLLTVHDAEESGTVYGNANVYLMNNAVQPVFDGMIRQQLNDGIFTTQEIKIKKSTVFTQESVFTFNTNVISGRVEKAVFRFYIFNADKDFSALLSLKGIARSFDNTLGWSTKPVESEFVAAAADVNLANTDVPSYVDWDITNYLNGLITAGTTNFTLKASVSAGNDVLLTGYASEKKSLVPQIIFNKETVLPLKISDFTVLWDNNRAKIQWTANLGNTAGFYQLWHAAADGKTFNLIKEIKSYEKDEKITCYHHQPQNGWNYYKLIELSSDAKWQGEEIRTINFTNLDNISVMVYPNPASYHIGFSVNNYLGAKLEAKLFDINGKILHTQTFNVDSGNYFVLNPKSEPPPGSYLLSIKGENLTKMVKVVFRR